MKFVTYASGDASASREGGLALASGSGLLALTSDQKHRLPQNLAALFTGGMQVLRDAEAILKKYGVPLDESAIRYLPPIPRPPKIFCAGLNYLDHTKESGADQPNYPTMFARFSTSFTGHMQPLMRPTVSEQFDYEGEMVVFIGKGGRHITRAAALDHVIGYSVCNEGSIRDYQFKAPQWTMGKNFDGSGAIGPAFVSADELPAGGKGLRLQTRLNGTVVQSANTSDMVFDVATLIAVLSEVITLEPGDVIVTGTPAGIGAVRKPPLWMKDGDIVEVEVEGVGVLRNPVKDEQAASV